jgi:predicted GNAT family acetyltransferase
MTESLLRRGQFTLAPVQRRDLEAARAMCVADEVANVVPLMHVDAAMATGSVPHGLWAVRRRGRHSPGLAGVLWCGANLTIVLGANEDKDDVLAQAAQSLVARIARPAAMVGAADITLDLWGRVEPWWGPARAIRPTQVSMAIDVNPAPVPADAGSDIGLEPLRQATMADYSMLLPAAAHMFTGEVGYDPLRHGRAAYEDRLQHLVRLGRSYIQLGVVDGKRDIVFKAEVGIVGGRVAQVQGVWVHPSLRGRGLSKIGMAALVPRVRAELAPVVSLYVNDFNAPAVAAYKAVGFREVGTFATVMF